jgi:DNA repair exonuclease SbcCD ATPase subunit
MNKKNRWIAYPGSIAQNTFGEPLDHYWLMWDIKSKDNFTATLKPLPNPKPFITIYWTGSKKDIFDFASDCPPQTRFRIISKEIIPQHYIKEITTTLRKQYKAGEVIIRIDQDIDTSVIMAGNVEFQKNDLSSVDTHLKLLKEFYSNTQITEKEWKHISTLLKSYVSSVFESEEATRNIDWRVKKLSFDNLFSFGPQNVINFENLSGITGIFGQNKLGKSSVIGTIAYSLFNMSDRGSAVKTIQMVNENSDYACSNISLSANGVDYEIERRTEKFETKKGEKATTQVKIYKLLNGERIEEADEKSDQSGEQRFVSDKVIRNIIGSYEDFLFTSLSVQGDMNKFINEKSTGRKQIISRFLGLDIFEKMHAICRKDLNTLETSLETVKKINWDNEIKSIIDKLTELKEYNGIAEKSIISKRKLLEKKQNELQGLKLSKYSPKDLKLLEDELIKLVNDLTQKQAKIEKIGGKIGEINKKKLESIEKISSIDIDKLISERTNRDLMRQKIKEIKNEYEREGLILGTQKKSSLILLDVPCGDQFPGCKFIKNSHIDRANIPAQEEKIKEKLSVLNELTKSFEESTIKNIESKISDFQNNKGSVDAYEKEIAKLEKEQELLEQTIGFTTNTIKDKNKLKASMEAEINKVNFVIVSEKEQEIKTIKIDLSTQEDNVKNNFAEIGRLGNKIETLKQEQEKYQKIEQQMRPQQLLDVALSRKGLSHMIISKQLPAINKEISNILNGIFDFDVEMECGMTDNFLDIYINDGGKRRQVELCCGAEKCIVSLAIRASLYRLSTLPKSNLLIIDEGIDVLDSYNIEQCSKFLNALKQYFSNILVISHVDAIKDCVDNIIEVNKINGFSKVAHE